MDKYFIQTKCKSQKTVTIERVKKIPPQKANIQQNVHQEVHQIYMCTKTVQIYIHSASNLSRRYLHERQIYIKMPIKKYIKYTCAPKLYKYIYIHIKYISKCPSKYTSNIHPSSTTTKMYIKYH
jgi:hypothetical protein